MIHSLEDKTKRELVEIVKIQIEEYQVVQRRVVELEEENLKAHGWIAKAIMQGLNKVDCSDELLKIIAIRDLEQQANGLEKLAESMLFRGHLENVVDRSEVFDYANGLREQAKQLKGGDL